MQTKHDLGQYFTTNLILKRQVFDFIKNEPKLILEPSIGQGDLVQYISSQKPHINFDMFEIDTKIKLLKNITRENINYGDFMNKEITKKYKTIVGNPPYVRTKKGNLYIDFTKKCFNLLEDSGELIFIIPSDFFKLTSSSKLLNDMMNSGSFTHIFHPNDENLFENASIDVIVYRYCKNKLLPKKVSYNNKQLFINNSDGLITFSEKENKDKYMFKDYFDIYVGIVSGKDAIYKNSQLGNINVLSGENKLDKFIFIEKYPSDNEEINKYLLSHKEALLKRRIKKFNEKNWYQWGAPRNISKIKNNLGKECIYINNLTRNEKVSFIGNINYFGGSLLMLKPKKNCDLVKIINYINSNDFKKNFTFSGRFKIGHRQISNSFIPDEHLSF